MSQTRAIDSFVIAVLVPIIAMRRGLSRSPIDTAILRPKIK
jgi:hypothetical protein